MNIKTVIEYLLVKVSFFMNLNIPGIKAHNVFDEVIENAGFEAAGET